MSRRTACTTSYNRTLATGSPSLAKINLDLRVLSKGPDSYHELHTVFQTVSLADTIDIDYTPARRSSHSRRGAPANSRETVAGCRLLRRQRHGPGQRAAYAK
jgi:4-diphosphocytidyl-2C-methyl-D-erythritol kinase